MRSILSLVFPVLVILGPHASYAHTLPKSCLSSCVSSFGTKLGENKGVVGYSNCNNDCESDEWSALKIGNQSHKSGMKWQCVEYARRWYVKQLGYTFDSIDHAYQIWDLEDANKLGSDAKTKWSKFANKRTKKKPRVNDLLIYNKKQGIHGHVSVIVKVAKGYVYIAEQNYANSIWEGGHYARKISLEHDKKGHYKLNDLGVIGWMRLASS